MASSSVSQSRPRGRRGSRCACASASSIVSAEDQRAERRLVDRRRCRGRRRRSAPASTSSLCGISSKPEVKFAISACSAMSRSVFFSPWPPIMIGGPPGRDRRRRVDGVLHAVVLALEGRPLAAEHGPADVQRLLEPLEALLHRREVDARAPRARRRTTRRRCRGRPGPCEMTSSVVTILARIAGLRYVTPVTSVPSFTRFGAGGERAEQRVAPRASRASGGPEQRQLVEVVHHHDGVEARVLGRDRDGRDPLEQLGRRRRPG